MTGPVGDLTEPMRFLLCEDEPDDAELIVRALKGAGFSFTWDRVETEEGFLAAIGTEEPDLIFADFSIPGFGALRALELLRERGFRIPTIVVSGTIGEELAAATVREGARDYVLKGNLPGLGRAVGVVLEQSRLEAQARTSEEARRESEARYAELFESANDVIFTHALDGTLTSINRAGEQATGYRREEHLGRTNVMDMLTPEGRELVRGALDRQLSGEVARPTFEIEIVRADRGRVPLEVSTNLVYEDGEPAGVLGIARDITERKEAEAALDESRNRLQGLFDNALDAILLADDEGRYVDANPAACALTGYSREELLQSSVWGLSADATEGGAPRLWRAFIEAGTQRGDFSLLRADGSVVETEYRATANIVPGLHLSAMRDVSKRRRAEQLLRESEERFRQLAEHAHQTFWIVDVDGEDDVRVAYVNPAFERMSGRRREEVVGDPGVWWGLVHPDDSTAVTEQFTRILRSGEHVTREYRIVRQDGAVRWLRDLVSPIRDEAGRVFRVVGIAEDITERKEAEAALKERMKELHCLYAVSRMAQTAVSKPELCAFVCEELTVAMQFPELARVAVELDGERTGVSGDAGEHRPELGASVVAGERTRGRVSVRYAEERPFMLPEEQALVDNVAGTLGRWLERTEAELELERSFRMLRRAAEDRRRLLARLVRAQEEERERIAADIHDDSVQAMTAVGMRLQGLRRQLSGPDKQARVAQLSESVETAISRLRRLLFDLRPRALDTDGIVAALRDYLEHSTRDTGISYEVRDRLTDEPPSETRIILYRIALEALGNVWKHARATHVVVTVEEAERGVLARVRDDGRGFDPESTDGNVPGHLGLVAMRERAETAGGWLRLSSREAGGTTVEFWLPLEQEYVA